MALQECGLNLNKVSKELQPHGSLEFPRAGYSSRHTDRSEDVIPWHWHEEMEIIYIEAGQMKIKIPSRSFLLERGDCIVINSNILHYAAAAVECRLRSLVFSPSLITGNEELVFAKKYMRPLLTCSNFSHYVIKAENNKNAAGWFNLAFDALAKDCYGYEFLVRENLSRICLFYMGNFSRRLKFRTFLRIRIISVSEKCLHSFTIILLMISPWRIFQAPPISARGKACAALKKASSFPPFNIC